MCADVVRIEGCLGARRAWVGKSMFVGWIIWFGSSQELFRWTVVSFVAMHLERYSLGES